MNHVLTFGVCLGFASVVWVPQVASQTRADPFLAAQQEGVAKNPKALAFTIRLKDNQAQFQQGEIIRVELAFSSALPKTYQLNGATYDRSDRLEIDSYHVAPTDGTVDPLEDKVRAWLGGERMAPILEEKPYLIVRELNEYRRFDKPGKYRLYVVSNRVEPGPQPATSNILEFTIVPADRGWARTQFESARAVLDSKDRREEEVQSAARIVRFLGTTDSVPYMVRHFDENQGDFSHGLIGSPLRAAVIREMEAGLEAPDTAVSTWYLSVLTMCAYAEKYAYRLGPYPGMEDKAKLEVWQQEGAKEQLARQSLRGEYVKRLAAAVLKKEGRAKAVSLNTLLSENGVPRPSLPAEFVGKLPSELAGVFFDLPVQTQHALLQSQWDRIKGPGTMSVLERYYQNPSQGQNWNDPTSAGIALQRIYETDPERGRELILKEIANPTGRVRFEVLAMLPDRTLPEKDEASASALEKRGYRRLEQVRVEAQLLARYATPAILPRVKSAWLEQNSAWSCEIQAPVIAYFLRVDPAYGAQALEPALSPAGRAQGGCYPGMLGSVAQFYASAELEAVATRHLDDSEPAVVLDAVETLGKYGSAAAEAPLWKRFEKWHAEWKDRAEEMQTRRIEIRPELDMAFRMQSAFPKALGTARGWLADAEKLKRIQALCLTKQEREEMGHTISAAEAPKKRLSFMPRTGGWTIEVAQYRDLSPLDAVKAKLAQFPKGTVFLWADYNPSQAEEEKKEVLGELRTFLAARGMNLEEPPPH